MQQGNPADLAEPKMERLETLRIAGISRHYPFEAMAGIPDQWQSFLPLIPRLADDTDPVTYGVIYNGGDDSFHYLTGVEVPPDRSTPETTVCLTLSPQVYLVFHHSGHVATLRETCSVIWSDWLPASGRTAVEAPWFERYGEAFDPRTGEGGLEIWIPVSV